MLKRVIRDAPNAWTHLNGIINVYKPAGMKIVHVKNNILYKLCSDLNNLTVREPRKRLSIDHCTNPDNVNENNGNLYDIINSEESNLNNVNPNEYVVKIVKDYADDILAVGERYQMKDFKVVFPANLGVHTSGVLLLGINNGIYDCLKLRKNKSIRVYHIKGCFGMATADNWKGSKILNRATYGHITKDKLITYLATLQANHQRKMYELCGVDMQSQAAYEMAAQTGLIKPMNTNNGTGPIKSPPIPIIYGLRCVEFKLPEFTIECAGINENESYLKDLILEIGIQLRSVAHCTGLRCIQHGHFHVDRSLLRGQQWSLQNILTNMTECRKIFTENPTILRPQSSNLFESIRTPTDTND